MFWQILSGIAAAAQSPGTGRKPTRFSFRFLALLIAAIWVLFGIWAWKRPVTCGETRYILTAGRVSTPATLHPRIRPYQRQLVRERSAE
jgi:hypothetical protein